MKYIREFKEGDRITGVYLCKHKQAGGLPKTGSHMKM